MEQNTDNSKLSRMTLGELESLPSYSGNSDDYTLLGMITLQGVNYKERIMGKRPEMQRSALYGSPEYDPKDANSFLKSVNGYLEFHNFVLTKVARDTTIIRKHQRVKGMLYKTKN